MVSPGVAQSIHVSLQSLNLECKQDSSWLRKEFSAFSPHVAGPLCLDGVIIGAGEEHILLRVPPHRLHVLRPGFRPQRDPRVLSSNRCAQLKGLKQYRFAADLYE